LNSLAEIQRVEDEYRRGVPALGRALRLLISRWQAGARDEKTVLRLLFLLWYAVAEPPYLTGLDEVVGAPSFNSVFEQAGGEEGASPLVLFALSVMIDVYPNAVSDDENDEAALAERSKRLREKALRERPDLSAGLFAEQGGAAGDYFQHIMKGFERRT